MQRFLRYNQICDEKLPLVKIWKNKQKIEMSLSQLLIFRDIQNLPLDMLLWMTNTMKLVKILLRITKDVKIQDGRQLWWKTLSVLRKWWEPQIMKYNPHRVHT